MIKEFRCFIEQDVDGQQVHTRLKDYDTGKYIGIQVLPQNKNKFKENHQELPDSLESWDELRPCYVVIGMYCQLLL